MVSHAQLLSNLLDNLDHLYDRDCLPEDTRALVLATAAAMASTPWEQLLLNTWEALDCIRQSDDRKRYIGALDATHELRLALADGGY